MRNHPRCRGGFLVASIKNAVIAGEAEEVTAPWKGKGGIDPVDTQIGMRAALCCWGLLDSQKMGGKEKKEREKYFIL